MVTMIALTTLMRNKIAHRPPVHHVNFNVLQVDVYRSTLSVTVTTTVAIFPMKPVVLILPAQVMNSLVKMVAVYRQLGSVTVKMTAVMVQMKVIRVTRKRALTINSLVPALAIVYRRHGSVMVTTIALIKLMNRIVRLLFVPLISFNVPTLNNVSMNLIIVMVSPTVLTLRMKKDVHLSLPISVTRTSRFSVLPLKFAFLNRGTVTALVIVKIHLMNRLLVVKLSVLQITSSVTILSVSSNRGSVTDKMTAVMDLMKTHDMRADLRSLPALKVNGSVLASLDDVSLWTLFAMVNLTVPMALMKDPRALLTLAPLRDALTSVKKLLLDLCASAHRVKC